ncbi:MAG: UxaA family hydrolase [Prevotella sp.]|nr:UxaA family hydrolase [Prevotella sp.]
MHVVLIETDEPAFNLRHHCFYHLNCQAIVFTTGRGTPTGNAIAPVLKVTANERTYRMMEDNMDVDLSAVLRGERTIVQMGTNWLISSPR